MVCACVCDVCVCLLSFNERKLIFVFFLLFTFVLLVLHSKLMCEWICVCVFINILFGGILKISQHNANTHHWKWFANKAKMNYFEKILYEKKNYAYAFKISNELNQNELYARSFRSLDLNVCWLPFYLCYCYFFIVAFSLYFPQHHIVSAPQMRSLSSSYSNAM